VICISKSGSSSSPAELALPVPFMLIMAKVFGCMAQACSESGSPPQAQDRIFPLGCASSSAVGLMPIPKEHPTAFLPSASGGHDSRVLHREQSTPVHFSSSGHSHCEQLKRDSFRAL